jgi:RHS repeat-associated protein
MTLFAASAIRPAPRIPPHLTGDGLNKILAPKYTATDPTENHYTGKERDTESGNDYFGARYYASSMGRFLSPDWSATEDPVPYAKLDNPQSLNLYGYVLNNPLSKDDLNGHEACTVEGMPVGNFTCTNLRLDIAEEVKRYHAVNRLVKAQNEAMKNKKYAPDPETGTTHCSEGACSIAHAMGVNTSGVLSDSQGHNYDANTQINNLADPKNGYKAVSPDEAQALADSGELVFATQHGSEHGHIASVRPEGVLGDNPSGNSGPLLANVGESNGVMRASAVFTPAHGEVVYYARVQ